MFSVHISLKKFENATITSHVGFVFEEIVTLSFWKSSILKMFSNHIKTQSRRFQIPRVWTAFSFEELPFSWQIIVDGRPNRRNKAAFSNFSGVVWMRPQYSCLLSITNQTWWSKLLKLRTGKTRTEYQIRSKSPVISQIVLADRLVGGFHWNANSLIPRVFVPLDQRSGNARPWRDPIWSPKISGRSFLQGACREQVAGWNLIITGKPLALKRNLLMVELPWLLHDAVYRRSEKWLPPKCQTGRSDWRRVYCYDFKPAMNYC